MFAGCWQIMQVYSHLIRVEGVGYWQFNSGRKSRCLQILRFMFAGRNSYKLKQALTVATTFSNIAFFFLAIADSWFSCPMCSGSRLKIAGLAIIPFFGSD
jgi:hypothetical protein